MTPEINFVVTQNNNNRDFSNNEENTVNNPKKNRFSGTHRELYQFTFAEAGWITLNRLDHSYWLDQVLSYWLDHPLTALV